MFAFFLDGEFKGVWGNRPGDEFYSATCKCLRWDESKTVLVYYPDHREIEELTYEYSVEKVIGKVIEKEFIKDEQGNIISETITNEEIITEINAELFAENGLLHKFC